MDLIRAARKGDEAAFLQLFDAHHAPLFRFAFRLTGSPADAEDIVQECFLGLLRPDSKYDPARTPLGTYLFGAVRNQALNRARGCRPVEPGGADPVDPKSPESQALQAELEAAVSRAVGELPDAQ